MTTPPARPPAPCRGYKLKKNAGGGFREYWEVAPSLARQGYRPTAVRLHFPDTPAGRASCAAKCELLTAEATVWLAGGGHFPRRGYDGTIASLAGIYETDPDSPFARMAWRSRETALQTMRTVVRSVGARRIEMVTGRDVMRWHRLWGEPTKPDGPARPHRAKGAIDRFRQLLAFGVVAGFADCVRLDLVMGKLRFPAPPERAEFLEIHHVAAIRAQAHVAGLPSIALAQVIAFELALRQCDVIGSWAPGLTQTGIVHRGRHWEKGLTWGNIDAAMVLTVRTSKTRALVKFDLHQYPAVLAELAHVPADRLRTPNMPLIISERSSLPWRSAEFARHWRIIADAAGIPGNLQFRDSRAGSITDALDAGASRDDVAAHATHKSTKMTARYDRSGGKPRTSNVARIRQASREIKDA